MESFQAELVDQSKVFEKGVYGLPEAVTNIQSLKSKITLLNEDRAGMSMTVMHATYVLSMKCISLLHCLTFSLHTASLVDSRYCMLNACTICTCYAEAT